jgi:hypothetical protein
MFMQCRRLPPCIANLQLQIEKVQKNIVNTWRSFTLTVKVHHVAFCLVLVHRGIRDHSAAYTEKFSIKKWK